MDRGVRVGGKKRMRREREEEEKGISSPSKNENRWEDRRKMRNKGRKSRRAVMSCRLMAA